MGKLCVGDRYRTESITVTETHVVNWAGLTGDWVPLHVDAEYAAATEFGERIAHGPLTLALALGLVTRTGIFGDCVVAWLGLDKVRLPLPVRFGDTITRRGGGAARAGRRRSPVAGSPCSTTRC